MNKKLLKSYAILASILLLAGTLYVPRLYAGTGDGGGDRPEIIQSVPYKNPEQLKLAKEIVIQKVSTSGYSDVFKKSMVDKLNDAYEFNKIRSIPNFIVLPAPGTKAWNGYSLPNEKDHFLTLGAFNDGDMIYASDSLLNVSAEELAGTLIHECAHMTTNGLVALDEPFIESLEESIMKGSFSRDLQFAIDHGLIIDGDNKVLRNEHIAGKLAIIVAETIYGTKIDTIKSHAIASRLNKTFAWLLRNEGQKFKMGVLFRKFFSEATDYSESKSEQAAKEFTDLVKSYNPRTPLANGYCKGKMKRFNWGRPFPLCDDLGELTLEEAFFGDSGNHL